MIVPDFAIVGTPKSGTSSLFYWLEKHPELQGSTPKETFFFMDEEHPLCGSQGASYARDPAEAYARFYPGPLRGRLRFEATTHYFYQRTARDVLTGGGSEFRAVLLLRNPADRILSAFRYTRDNLGGLDPDLTFDRFAGYLLEGRVDRLDRYYRVERSLYIAKRQLELNRYLEWVDWWLERLPRERLHLVVFEELKAEPQATVQRVCRFVGIDAGWFDDFEFSRHNPTFAIRSHGLHRLALRMRSWLPSGRLREIGRAAYLRWQSGAPPRDEFETGMRALREHFAPFNRELDERFELELDRWWGAGAGC